MQPTVIAERAKRIRLSRKDIATAARVNPNTVSRAFNQRNDPRLGTHTEIDRAVREEEIALRDYLVSLHGLPDLPAGTDVVTIGGVPRRVVMPAIEPKAVAA